MSAKVTCYPAARLSDALTEQWAQLQNSIPELDTPFLDPRYALDAAAIWNNVEVGVMWQDDEPAAFFPFQRTARNVGVPIGGLLNDLHGIVVRPDFQWNSQDLLRGCRLSGWRFTQLIAEQQPFQEYHWSTDTFHSADLSEGFDAYCRRRRESGSQYIPKLMNKCRKGIREAGPLRFVNGVDDPEIFDKLVEWKSEQYRQINAVNHLTNNRALEFIQRLLARRENDFRGLLTTMYFGEQLAAINLNIRRGAVLHGWFITYNKDLSAYSPGSVALLEQAKAAAECGITRYDLGRGDVLFKTGMASGGRVVAEGAVGLGFLSNSVQRAWLHSRNWVLKSRLKAPARAVVRKIRGLFLSGSRHESVS